VLPSFTIDKSNCEQCKRTTAAAAGCQAKPGRLLGNRLPAPSFKAAIPEG